MNNIRAKKTFSEAKFSFDKLYENKNEFKSIVPCHLKVNEKIRIKNKSKKKNEEYFKWQFVTSIINSGLYPIEHIGTEVYFPKGNKSSAPIKLDVAIFNNKDWFIDYKKYHEKNDLNSLEKLRKKLVFVIEIKKEDSKDIESVWTKQLKPYLKESERDFCLGAIYDTERLYIFSKNKDKYLRFSQEYNLKGDSSTSKDLSLNLPDPYINLISLKEIENRSEVKKLDRSKRKINDLDLISGIQSIQINDSMSSILRTMDKQGLVNQRGFEILIQIISLKIFDEKRNENNSNSSLDFHISEDELREINLSDELFLTFVDRFKSLMSDALSSYPQILKNPSLDLANLNHVKVLIEVVKQFQDYSFVLSHKSDLYQLVFYKFATPFAKDQNAQFITPLRLIEFLVSLVNPRGNETVIDPTVGIADFLSVSFVNSISKLSDKNIYGIDVDDQMVMLATLNMLLNGDGNAKILSKKGMGSLESKFSSEGDLIDLIPNVNKDGNWDTRTDGKKLKKFDVVLTNPPFGEDRAFSPKDTREKEIVECYELWNKYQGSGKKINKVDLGVLFLENAVRILKTNGRMGIVLSNSLASIDAHRKLREWIFEKLRVVATFDLPPSTFAETQVNTTLLLAYKPETENLIKLQKDNYDVFVKDIKNIGYEIKTSKRVRFFSPIYQIDYTSFETKIDEKGNPQLLEDFTTTISEFKEWVSSQETKMKDIFLSKK